MPQQLILMAIKEQVFDEILEKGFRIWDLRFGIYDWGDLFSGWVCCFGKTDGFNQS
ncbi:hypothetical protein [Pseudocnuella soli]|uniref:hypothetical protein n=1 Tax=Pseudocnuella soli TaxID=2502779 RepID=UPI0014043A82|nr:hypothetical protein [Pseudocnuella soli]